MREPQEICDEEHEQILERVAAVDVAKASGMVGVRVPDGERPGRRRTLVWEVPATTNAVLELGEHLARERIQKVTLEATSDYWRIWFYLLEAAGLDVQLVKAHDVKQAPGRGEDRQAGCGVAGEAHPCGACSGPRSCRRPRSAPCATTPGCAPT